MPNLLIRDLDPRVLARLKANAKKNNRSMSAEAKHILEQNLPFSWEASIAELERIRQPIGSRRLSPSAPLIREDREHRGDHLAQPRSTGRSTLERRARK
jgi:plasmid stability protein